MPRLLTKITLAWPVDSADPWKAMTAALPLRERLDALRAYVQENGGSWEETNTMQAWTRRKGEPDAAPELPMPPSCSSEPPPSQAPSRDELLDVPEFLRRVPRASPEEPKL